jgi:hypothetical protein
VAGPFSLGAGCTLLVALVIVGVAGVVLCVCVGRRATVVTHVSVWMLCCFDVVETSFEGHMVDALASRADEGRWSLR